MQRLGLILLCVTLLTLGWIPSQAQGGSIASIIEQRSTSGLEFTTLQRFIESSDLAQELSTRGTYTLFAPTDDAFERLERAINFSTTDLLANPDIVNAIVRYHTLDTELSASELRNSDGRVILTQLRNAFVGITQTTDDEIIVNNVVEIITSDISASNGVIHIINDVLLNRVINDLLGDEFSATPSAVPTALPTSTPPPTSTPSAQVRSTANVRVLHLASDTPEVTLQLNSMMTTDAIAYEDVTEFRNVPQGIYTVTAISLDNDDEFTLRTDLTLLNGDFVTLALIGSLENNTLDLINFTDELSDLADDEVRITLFNALPNAPSISLVLDDENLFEGISFAEREVDTLDAGTVNLQVIATRDSDTVFLDVARQTIDAEGLYWVVLYGMADTPEVLVLENNAESIAQLSMATPETSTTPDAETTEDAMSDSIVDILDAERDFTTLIQLLTIADSSILDSLGNSNATTVTFLAPNDQAFENLLATTGLRLSQITRDPELLDNILRYHIIEDTFSTEDFINASGTSITTSLEPSQAFFVRATDDGSLFLNGTVEFVATDIRASNGIIHIVDDVLLPLVVIEALDL